MHKRHILPSHCSEQPPDSEEQAGGLAQIWQAVGVQVRVVRIFNTYGPRMALDDGRVVSNFVTQALTGTPLTIYGDGQQTRSFQYISDLIQGAPLGSLAVRASPLPAQWRAMVAS